MSSHWGIKLQINQLKTAICTHEESISKDAKNRGVNWAASHWFESQ